MLTLTLVLATVVLVLDMQYMIYTYTYVCICLKHELITHTFAWTLSCALRLPLRARLPVVWSFDCSCHRPIKSIRFHKPRYFDKQITKILPPSQPHKIYCQLYKRYKIITQGSCISPILFNFFISDLPPPPKNSHIISYADDITVYTSHPNIETSS